MNFGKRLALSIYQRWTWRERRGIRSFLDATQQWPAAILFYHRVADSFPNDWSIGRRNFARHLDWIAREARFVSLAELQRSQQASARGQLTVSITFDDGYGENCDWALPELKRRNIPCTYFVTNDFVKSGRPFPHDAARNTSLRPNTIEEIRRLADEGFDIGGHTATHLDLGGHWPRPRLLQEIRDTRRELQDWTGQAIPFFAFPYGKVANMSQAAIDAVYEAGYQGFVSAYGGWNWLGEDNFHLQRFHGDRGLASLSNWLTLDPRKFNRCNAFHYARPKLETSPVLQQLDSVTEALEAWDRRTYATPIKAARYD